MATTDASGEIIIDEAGLVHEYRISISTSGSDTQAECSYAHTLEAPTIEEPAWASGANATAGA